jgi:transglutaminase-like putative cysteine protease
MTLGGAHEFSLLTATLSALLLVLLGGELPALTWLTVVVPPFSFILKRRGLAAAPSSGTALGLASVGLGFARLFIDGAPALVHAFGLMLAGLVAARALTRTTLAHDMQVLLLSLLLVLAGSVLNRGPSFLLLFLLFALAAVVALSTRQLLVGALVTNDDSRPHDGANPLDRIVRARTDIITPVFFAFLSSVAVVVLVSAALLFALFPRIGFFDLGLQTAGSGQFPSQVSLAGSAFGGSGATNVVARVRGQSVAAFERGLYLRGSVYDIVDESGFSRSERPPRLSRRAVSLARAPEEVLYEVSLFPGAGDILFSLGDVHHVTNASGGRQNPNMTMPINPPDNRSELHAGRPLSAMLRYDVRGGVASPGFVPDAAGPRVTEDLAHYLALPDDIDPRISALASTLKGDASTPEQTVARIRDTLLDQWTYTLFRRESGESVPLRAFLFDTKEGHCEFFAAAFAMLLRTQGIPSRVIGGFQGGFVDDEDGVVVFQGGNAHAWVEWYLDGKGWIVDDATPAAGAPRLRLSGFAALLETWRRFWDDRIVDYSFEEQAAALRAAQRAISPERIAESAPGRRGVAIGASLIAALLIAFFVIRRARQRAASDVPLSLAHAIEGALARIDGTTVDETDTYREALSRSRAKAEAHALLIRALRLYEATRFGGVPPSPAHVAELVRELAALRAPDPAEGHHGRR